ncbi:MAG: TetR/AcrR family transcriptional regulator [Bacilli bacterium]
MPTKTFLNLSKDRQDLLINAAKIEFSNYLFEDASINRIIKSINMSRGTFYLYFKNKEDIYYYILEKVYSMFLDTIKEIKSTTDGDPKEMLIALYDKAINKQDSEKLMAKVFINFNSKHVEKVMPFKNRKKYPVLSNLNFNNYKIDEEEKYLLIHIFQTLFIQNIALSLRNKEDSKEIREIFIKEIDIIIKGLERRITC